MKCAVFPLAEMVVLPGETVTLHIFEPRYRQMIHECVKNETLVGVSLAGEKIASGKVVRTLEEALSSNQDTFHSNEIFGCGTPKITKILKDCRIFIELEVSHKVKINEYDQMLPFLLCDVDVLEKHAEGDSFEGSESLKTALLNIFTKTGLGPFLNLEADLETLPCSQIVLEALKIFPLKGEAKQELLESANYAERADLVAKYLTNKYSDMSDLSLKRELPAKLLQFPSQ